LSPRRTEQTPWRSAPKRLRPALAGRCACVAALLLSAVAGPGLAFSPDAPSRPDEPTVEAPTEPDAETVLRHAAQPSSNAGKTLMDRITKRLRRLPLRPVMIGEQPRTPDDPEPGAGMTVFIRF